MIKNYIKICSNYVTFITDELIKSDENGACNYINYLYSNILYSYYNYKKEAKELAQIVDKIKKEYQDKQHYCIKFDLDGIADSYKGYIRSIGTDRVVTIEWANEVFNSDMPDMYFEVI